MQPRVVGGSEAPSGAYPWQVALVSAAATNTYSGQFCGGTLIAPDIVLTAFHCVEGLRPTSLDVVAGTSMLGGSDGQRRDVTAISSHPNATSTNSLRYDVAKLTLAAPVTGGAATLATVAPSPSSDDLLWNPGALLTITGWGDTQASDSPPANLHEAQVPRVSDSACTSAYGSEFGAASMVCAGYDEGGVDTCQGDSGGPLIAPSAAAPATPDKTDPAHWRLVGVTSWGYGCAEPGAPGVYARLGTLSVQSFQDAAPHNTTPPAVTGTPRVGDVVTCEAGSWSGDPATFGYRFYRRSAAGKLTLLANGTSPTYTVTAADYGQRLLCRVRAENEAGFLTVESLPVGPVTNAGPVDPPANVSAPVLTGQPAVGATLSCARGTWGGDPAAFTYTFLRRAGTGTAVAIVSGEATTYKVTAADAGHSILCRVRGQNEAGFDEADSAALGPVPGTAPPPEPRDTATPPPVREDPAPPTPPAPPAGDSSVPHARATGRVCNRRRVCRIKVIVDDLAPSAGIATLRAKLLSVERVRCRRRGKRRVCTRTRRRAVAVRRLSGGLFTVRTPVLRRGRHRLSLAGVDRAGHAQLVPTLYRWRLR